MFRFRKCAAALALCSVLMLVGCPSVSAIDVAAKIATSAASILTTSNPEAAGYLAQVGSDLSLISALAKQPASGGTTAEIQQRFAAISDRLPQILEAVHIKSPQLTQEITVAVAVVNAALKIIAGKLPPGAVQAPQTLARTTGQPSVGKTADDFKKAWNNAVKDSHPQAKI